MEDNLFVMLDDFSKVGVHELTPSISIKSNNHAANTLLEVHALASAILSVPSVGLYMSAAHCEDFD